MTLAISQNRVRPGRTPRKRESTLFGYVISRAGGGVPGLGDILFEDSPVAGPLIVMQKENGTDNVQLES